MITQMNNLHPAKCLPLPGHHTQFKAFFTCTSGYTNSKRTSAPGASTVLTEVGVFAFAIVKKPSATAAGELGGCDALIIIGV